MRDTNDMMEDAICEDTMMECSGDGGGLEDLVNLASDIADSAPSIRDAAERLLTLLGVDEDDDASSSEDEGVEVDLEDSDSDEPQDTRLLHQLAATLAQELKYAKQNSSNTKLAAQSQNVPEIYVKENGSVQSMDFVPDGENQVIESTQINSERSNPFGNYSSGIFYRNENAYLPRHPPPPYQYKSSPNNVQYDDRCSKNYNFGTSSFYNYTNQVQRQTDTATTAYDSSSSSSSSIFEYCSRIGESEETRLTDPVSWGVGWDACASEALRYLVEDEGLPPHHPTVLAMKNHLDLQRSRVVSQFAA